MLFHNILIVKEVLLVDTEAVPEVPVIMVEPTHIQGIINPKRTNMLSL